MKLRTTTPASVSSPAQRAKKAFLFSAALVLASVGSLSYFQSQSVSADQYDDQIAELQADMARYQKEADRLNKQSITLKNTLEQIANDKKALQAKIDISQAQYNKLVLQIKETEKEIADNQDALGNTIADLYVDDEISPIEMLASSENIGEFLNKQEYRSSVQDELGQTIKRVRDLKAQLTTQKESVSKVLAEQKDARELLVAKENEQAQLLAQTNNSEAKYQGMIKNTKKQIAAARALQAAFNNISNNGSTVIVESGMLSDYPWNTGNCYVDTYAISHGGSNNNGGDGYGYGCRQCVSYVAWRIAKETGEYYSFLGNGGDVAYNLLNHKDSKHKYKNLGSRPQPGSIAVMYSWKAPPYGHVAWVEAVSPDGTQVLVSQYNYKDYRIPSWGMYSKMWMPTSSYNQYVIRK